MKINQVVKSILKGIKNSIRRFPQAIGISAVCVILLIVIGELTNASESEELIESIGKITMVLAMGIPVSLCINLYFERLKDYKKYYFYSVYGAGAILLVIYYFLYLKDFEMVTITRYIGTSLVLYLIFLFISYLPNKDNYEAYVIKVFSRLLTTVLYSVVLYLGIAAILATTELLLEVNIQGRLYYYSWLVIIGVFAPSFLLAEIPVREDVLSVKDYSKLLKVLVLYIIIPLISVYTLILYIYFGKVIITSQWPEGLVSHLVLWYSVISAAVLFFITPMVREIKWVERYMKIYPKVLLPLIALMFVSIGIRINAYGVTENRYYVVALGIWVLIVMSYFSFVKSKKNIIIPISLAIITFISVFGPISSYSLSKYSQNKRFEQVLMKNAMFVDNKAIKATANVSEEDARTISSILNYFDYNHSLEDIKTLPEGFQMNDMEKVLGVEYIDKYYNTTDYFYFSTNEDAKIVDIKEYDYMFSYTNRNLEALSEAPLAIKFNDESGNLEIMQNGEEIYSKDFKIFINNLLKEYDATHKNDLPIEIMSYEEETDAIKVRVEFDNISGERNVSTGEIEYSRYSFDVFFTVK
ncbi:DUF4153 domain-containing protein [Vallitalea okinawensis]|uniref:DUF4153 domain-containing protein n=1 Tax=Vallitalea okinawensis TaxID=2078660 RepID=UPI000CFD8B24|nr:DUF4153 domain-containing protein [Vallitalea okinawensis]